MHSNSSVSLVVVLANAYRKTNNFGNSTDIKLLTKSKLYQLTQIRNSF